MSDVSAGTFKKWLATAECAARSRNPSVRTRAIVACAIAIVAGFVAYNQFGPQRPHSDFGMVWYGARALLRHVDPYVVIGPGREFNYEWPLIYPATALVAVIPLAWAGEVAATVSFVAITSWLLGFGITRDGWYRIPLFFTSAFVTSAMLGQWSILFTAALFIPELGFFAAVKPQAALPVLAGSTRSRMYWAAAIGLCVLLTASFLMDPHWIPSWFNAVRKTENMGPPIIRMGGPLLLLTLLRWREPETWLLLSLAALPQSWGWYNTLPLFVIPRTFRQSVFLAATAMFGAWYADYVLNPASLGELVQAVGSVIVFTIYLPAAALILMRPNNGPLPVWLSGLTTRTSMPESDRQGTWSD